MSFVESLCPTEFVICCACPSSLHLVPLLQHQPSRPILSVLLDLLVLQPAERFTGEILAVNVFGIEDVAQFVAGKTEVIHWGCRSQSPELEE